MFVRMPGGGRSSADGVDWRHSTVQIRLNGVGDLFEVAAVCVQVTQRVGVPDVVTPWIPRHLSSGLCKTAVGTRRRGLAAGSVRLWRAPRELLHSRAGSSRCFCRIRSPKGAQVVMGRLRRASDDDWGCAGRHAECCHRQIDRCVPGCFRWTLRLPSDPSSTLSHQVEPCM